ncbi:MAG: histidine--tRNA ligase [Clostridia bacterium]|nr:histidine--tRNA ligase [Clostridia bacterium]
MLTKAPRGTADILPESAALYRFLEDRFIETATAYGFREIRTPVFEHTELFNRSVGETTDVVQKEMYTFNDNGGRSITLRPEGTAGVARAVLEHGLTGDAMPLKLFYITSCYRYEKPQAGRLREFHQFGVEYFGSEDPAADAETIALADGFLSSLEIGDYSLRINSIGCPACRAEYHKALKGYFEKNLDRMCGNCRERFGRNPMRLLDCKVPECHEIAAGAPSILDYLCDGCRAHFTGVQRQLNVLEIPFEIDPHIVRGLDYYTRTVFEFVSDALGAQATVCGGGRYDGLLQELGGKPVPALGFGMGEERLRLIYENARPENDELLPETDVYLIAADDAAKDTVTRTVNDLRRCGMNAERDVCGRSVKAQMKYAGRLGANFTMILGGDELAKGFAAIRNMKTGETGTLPLKDLASEILIYIGDYYLSQLDGEDDGPDEPSARSAPENAPGLTVLRGGKDE